MTAAKDDGGVDLYCDLHRKWSSIKALTGPMKGRVVDKPKQVVLCDVTLRVSQAGVQKVRESGVRSVHAFARGTPTPLTTDFVQSHTAAIRVRYNPHLRGDFFDADSGDTVQHLALLAVDGKSHGASALPRTGRDRDASYRLRTTSSANPSTSTGTS